MVVVDNASSAGERERLAREAPAARVVAFSRNLGFAGGANEGIARTRAPFVLLLNNDAVLEPDYVARLAARLELDGRLAAAQGLVLSEDGRQIDTAGLEWNGRGEAVPVLSGGTRRSRPASRSKSRASRRRRRCTGARRSMPWPAGARSSTARSSRTTRTWTCRCGSPARDGGSCATRAPSRATRARARAAARRFAAPSGPRATGGARSFATSRPGCSRGTCPRSCVADLAHARAVGWTGIALPLLVWPRVPLDGAGGAARSPGGSSSGRA